MFNAPVRRVKHTWRRIRTVAWSAAQIGVILAVGFFVFQLLQYWGDGVVERFGLSATPVLRWAIPSISSLAAALVLGFIFLIWNTTRVPRPGIPPSEQFAAAILEYGRQLSVEGRDRALLNLRNNLTATLHILGFHRIRVELGELALQSAAVVSDQASKAEILVDDLGWAHHLLTNNSIAISYIERGVSTAAKARTNGSIEGKRLILSEAKGLRHLAVIGARDSLEIAGQKLDTALELLASLDHQDAPDVMRDIAQIHHAHALVVALAMDLQRSGRIRVGDTEGAAMIEEALENLRTSSAIFKDIGDLDRYVKALFLEVRLLEAKGNDTEAREVASLRDRTLAASEWIRPEGSRSLTGG